MWYEKKVVVVMNQPAGSNFCGWQEDLLLYASCSLKLEA